MMDYPFKIVDHAPKDPIFVGVSVCTCVFYLCKNRFILGEL